MIEIGWKLLFGICWVSFFWAMTKASNHKYKDELIRILNDAVDRFNKKSEK